MRIQLLEKRREGMDVISFLFDLGGQALRYIPGEYLFSTSGQFRFPGRPRMDSPSHNFQFPTEPGSIDPLGTERRLRCFGAQGDRSSRPAPMNPADAGYWLRPMARASSVLVILERPATPSFRGRA
jgi:hypothetical protein